VINVINATDAKEIALHFLGAKMLPVTHSNVSRNIIIAKSILELGFPVESIIIAIDLNVDKMYSLGYIKFVIEETHNAIMAKAKENEIRDALTKINNEKIIYVESEGDGKNRNKDKLARKSSKCRFRTSTDNNLFK
jgi:hypothetical protein